MKCVKIAVTVLPFVPSATFQAPTVDTSTT